MERTETTTVHEGIHLVDLGLTSKTLWADRNLGADAPEESGDYYRFGETVPFTEKSPEYTYDKIEGDIAGTDRDAATMNLGKNYRMPTNDQFKELIDECKWEWTTQNGVNGMMITGHNGNSIFLPAAGIRSGDYDDGRLYDVGSGGDYWSASPYDEGDAGALYFYSGYWNCNFNYRSTGRAVRPVSK